MAVAVAMRKIQAQAEMIDTHRSGSRRTNHTRTSGRRNDDVGGLHEKLRRTSEDGRTRRSGVSVHGRPEHHNARILVITISELNSENCACEFCTPTLDNVDGV